MYRTSRPLICLAAIALSGLGGTVIASDLGGALKGVSGGDTSSLMSASTGNVAGIVEFCIKNNYLGGGASGIKDQLMGKLGGEQESDTDKTGFADGAKGLLNTSDGKTIDLSEAGGAADIGGMKTKLTKKACSAVLDQAKSLL